MCLYLSNGILKDLELEDDTMLLFIELKRCVLQTVVAEDKQRIEIIFN